MNVEVKGEDGEGKIVGSPYAAVVGEKRMRKDKNEIEQMMERKDRL